MFCFSCMLHVIIGYIPLMYLAGVITSPPSILQKKSFAVYFNILVSIQYMAYILKYFIQRDSTI